MLDRWRDLDDGQRRVLAILGSLVVVVALVVAVASLTGSSADHQAVRTDDPSSTSSTTSAEVTTTAGAGGSTSTSSATAAKEGSSTTSTTAGGATTTPVKATGSKGPTSTTARGATTTTPTTTRAPTTTTRPVVAGPCNPGGGTAPANDIANLFCAYRANQGLAPMSRNAQLDQEAQAWAQHMADQAAAGGAPSTVLAHNLDPSTGYKAAVLADCNRCNGWAENVAYDTSSANAWNGWLASSGHLADIRGGADGGEYGVGAASGGGFTWFVQDFGRYP